MATLEEMKVAFWEKIKEDLYNAHWHYMFADWLEENGFDDEAELQRQWTVEKQKAAEAFMDGYAAECSRGRESDEDYAAGTPPTGRMTRDKLLQIAHRFLINGSWYTLIGQDTPEIVYDRREEFWQHFMVLTGRPVPSNKREEQFIGCSC